MKPILFSYVTNRKRALQSSTGIQKISYEAATKNLNTKNLLMFIESGCIDNPDTHFNQSIILYNGLLTDKDITEQDKNKINRSLLENLPKLTNLEAATGIISRSKLEESDKESFIESLNILENCDRVLRNESKLAKRFDMNKIINSNIIQGTKHTVFELCSLLDTYEMSSKAKMNIALENVLYSLYKSGHKINLSEATEYIVEYFLTRDYILTDKEFKGYTDVLKNNNFTDHETDNISYIFDSRETYGSSFADTAAELAKQCVDSNCAEFITSSLNIKNEKQASEYFDNVLPMILSDAVCKDDALLLFKSLYCLPLIGNISKDFIDYKFEMSEKKLDVKKKLTGIENEKGVRDTLEADNLLEVAMFVNESVHFENYIFDDNYMDETDPIKLLEAEGTDSENIKKIIDSFKASNEKSPSKFKNMISRILTKSPENIINETPNIFGVARFMLYIGVAASPIPLAPIFAAILALVTKLLSMHLDLKQSEKLLKHLESEKEKAEKKLEKLSGKDKENQEAYIKCIKDCISKTKDFISKIDDDSEALNSSDDDFDFDFNFESAITESGSIVEFSAAREVLNELSESLDKEILVNIAPLFDNCSTVISDDFYKLVEDNMNESKDSSLVEACKLVLENKGRERISEEENYFIQCEAELALQEVVKSKKPVDKKKKSKGGSIDLATLKMAVLNFKKKFRDLKGKEQELWRNIDIATSNLTRGIQQALTSDRREAIIKGSIIPSFSKCIKSAIAIGGIGYFTGPVGAAITAIGMFAASKYLNDRERKLLYDEIDTELQVVEKQIQLAENEGDMNQYRFLLNYQKKLTREKHRIKYGVHMSGRTIPEIKRGE